MMLIFQLKITLLTLLTEVNFYIFLNFSQYFFSLSFLIFHFFSLFSHCSTLFLIVLSILFFHYFSYYSNFFLLLLLGIYVFLQNFLAFFLTFSLFSQNFLTFFLTFFFSYLDSQYPHNTHRFNISMVRY